MQYIASISYGKDSLAMLEVIRRHKMPLDRIIHAEVMATPTIHADLPPMVEFKAKADAIIKDMFGIEVERVRAEKSYEEYFYFKFKKGKNKGRCYGWPYLVGPWCNDRLKAAPLDRTHRKYGEHTVYIGIAVDEPRRMGILTGNKRSPLVEHGITEQWCYDWCKENDLLSPIYTTATRGGCWFCHNQGVNQLYHLRKNYPEYWKLLLKWDKDSPVSFKPDGTTVHDFEKRFDLEDRQMSFLTEGIWHE
ncbi:MAG: reductase [Christensenellales bacterium]|mgnify:CR=1 FL=1|jgi:3'-phosphoadenosine 5'-phosphosulfate sulfotransferase (PAPS reductase)/FAD synthetase